MKIGVISFTARGTMLCCRLAGWFQEDGEDCIGFVPERFWNEACAEKNVERRAMSPGRWAGDMFRDNRAMVFVGAAGIAVRAIAPFVKDKLIDPPVVVVDEAGQFAVPILSGHVGGANELAIRIAGWLKAVPVITTATDVNRLFAVDVFAALNGLALTDRQEARRVSALLLEGGTVGFINDCSKAEEGKETVPQGCAASVCARNIWITVRDSIRYFPDRQSHVLRLVPKAVVAGIGCRRAVDPGTLERQVMACLGENGIDPAAVKALATIDIKRDEDAILKLASKMGWELRFYTRQELLSVEGRFEESDFVKQAVGVGNVCERACLAGGGTLLFGKNAGNGVAMAAALEDVKLSIEKYI